MLPIRNIFYLSPMCWNFWEKSTNSHKIGLGCSTPINKKYPQEKKKQQQQQQQKKRKEKSKYKTKKAKHKHEMASPVKWR